MEEDNVKTRACGFMPAGNKDVTSGQSHWNNITEQEALVRVDCYVTTSENNQ